MNKNSLVSIDDISREDILDLIERARYFEENPSHKVLDGKVVATLFFEPSTRTRLSFETAVNRLGGRIIGFSDASTTSSSKGETLKDTIIMVSNYVDLIVMRHYLEGAARYATEVTDVPIINAGIKGVLNFTSVPMNFPQGIVVENYDITTILEKVAYFVKAAEENNNQ